MGSVVVSEVVHDTPHYPHSTMLATPHAQAYQTPRHSTSSSTQSVDSTAASHPPASTPAGLTGPAARQSSDLKAPSSPQIGTADRIPAEQVPTQTSFPPPQSSSKSSIDTLLLGSSTHGRSAPQSPKRIKIRDLGHIQSFVEDEESIPSLAATGQIPAEKTQELPQYEISGMPVTDVIEMVAGLLTKITTTNDDQAERLHKDIPSPEYAAKMNPMSNSVLAFHGKNIPTISIMSYLTRIHKYCPATYEVFLSLLVYFDRITEKVNATPRSPYLNPNSDGPTSDSKRSPPDSQQHLPSSNSDLREADRPERSSSATQHTSAGESAPSEYPSPPPPEPDPYSLGQYFVVDSFNIHRLIIAGVTCASKFFSDVFYTNSRYAKVGGLPLPELNNLEVQFLLMNDFRLSIPVEELEAYGTMLVEFYAREVIAQRHEAQTEGPADVSAN